MVRGEEQRSKGRGEGTKGQRGEGAGQKVKEERDKSSKCHVCKYKSMQQEIFMKCNTQAIVAVVLCIIQCEDEYHQAALWWPVVPLI